MADIRLMQDDRGEEIRLAQEAMLRRGMNLDVDGYMGPMTAYGVAHFQRKVLSLKLADRTMVPADARLGILDGLTFQSLINMNEAVDNKLKLDDALESYAVLPVPYLSQRDNQYKASSTCNVTSVAMCLAYAGAPIVVNAVSTPQNPSGRLQLEDYLYTRVTGMWGQTVAGRVASWAVGKVPLYQVHAVLTELLKTPSDDRGAMPRFPLATWSDKVTPERVWDSIHDHKLPVILATQLTASGHIVVAVGMTKAGDLIINDPWGDWRRGYGPASINGKKRFIPKDEIWTALRKPGSAGVMGIFMTNEV